MTATSRESHRPPLRLGTRRSDNGEPRRSRSFVATFSRCFQSIGHCPSMDIASQEAKHIPISFSFKFHSSLAKLPIFLRNHRGDGFLHGSGGHPLRAPAHGSVPSK